MLQHKSPGPNSFQGSAYRKQNISAVHGLAGKFGLSACVPHTRSCSCTLHPQIRERERERQQIVSFQGDVTTLGLFHTHVWRLHVRT